MAERPCEVCHGLRLRPEALAVTVQRQQHRRGDRLAGDARAGVGSKRRVQGAALTRRASQKIAIARFIKEITARLKFLVDVGLDYLTLGRTAASLSGGEAPAHPAGHPDRLAADGRAVCAGRAEHRPAPARQRPADPAPCRHMRDLGNTLLVVEHDDETIRAADWVVDLGPGAGEHGGKLVFEGTVAQILKDKKSHHRRVSVGRASGSRCRAERRPGNGKYLVIRGARENNLKDIDVRIPLGKFVCLTGRVGLGQVVAAGGGALQAAVADAARGARAPRRASTGWRAWSTSTRSSTSTRAPSGARRAATPARMWACSTRSATCLPSCPRAEDARLQGRAL